MGRFLPMTEAIFWSDALGEATDDGAVPGRQPRRTQILAPFKEQDVWAGVMVSAAGEPRAVRAR